MPSYLYQNPKTYEIIEVIQRMTEKHVFVDSNGLQWNRIFSVPNAQVDSCSTINPFDRKDFVKKTAKPGMTMGDMWDESAKLSEKRAKVYGQDPIKEQAKKNYEKRCNLSHPLA